MKKMLMKLLLLLLWICPTSAFLRRSPIHVRSRAHAGSTTARRMFSGIVEDVGIVEEIIRDKTKSLWDGKSAEGTELVIRSPLAVSDASIGCSIAVNGVCLTATKFDHEKFTVGVSPETLRRTNLMFLEKNSRVHVERALAVGARNSGHFVQGHVDSMGRIIERWNEGDSLWLKVAPADLQLMKYIVPKGFVALDGASLTVCDVYNAPFDPLGSDESEIEACKRTNTCSWFTIMLVPHTQQSLALPSKLVSHNMTDLVNIEVDITGKLVEGFTQDGFSRVQREMEDLRGMVLALAQEVKQLKTAMGNAGGAAKHADFKPPPVGPMKAPPAAGQRRPGPQSQYKPPKVTSNPMNRKKV